MRNPKEIPIERSLEVDSNLKQKRDKYGRFEPTTWTDIKKIFRFFVVVTAIWSWAIAIQAYSELDNGIIQTTEYIIKEKEIIREIEKECPRPITKQDTVKRIAEEEGVDWRIVWAICKVESNCNPIRIGDGGQSYGAFQIHKPSHPDIAIEQMKNFEWSARWTAKRIKKYEDINLAFKQHNGIGKTTNQWYINKCLAVYKTL